MIERLIRTTPSNRIVLFLAIVSALIFLPFLGAVHLFDWDEINFAECAREMIVTGDYFRVHIDYEPFWEKPPLFIWLQAASMLVFGVNEFAARFPNAVVGIITVIVLFRLGESLRSKEFGVWWALCYIGSLLPHFYFRTGIIDPLFNLLIFLSVHSIIRHAEARREGRPAWKHTLWIGIAAGAAVMTKGPVAILLAGLTWVVISVREYRTNKAGVPFVAMVASLGIALAVCCAWFGADYLAHGPWFIEQFITYQLRLLTTGDAGHSGPIYYHVVVLLVGCFPASVLMWSGIRHGKDDTENVSLYRFAMLALLCVVVVIFSIVKTKIVHYSSMAYYPITFLGALGMERMMSRRERLGAIQFSVMLVQFGVLAVALIAFPLALINKHLFLDRIQDGFTRMVVATPVQWSGWEWMIGVLFGVAAGAGLFTIRREAQPRGFMLLFGATVGMVALFLPVIAPKIEGYTQATPIAWYQYYAERNCHITQLGFKSYAPLFYAAKPYSHSAAANGIPYSDYEAWLLRGAIDRPAYFVCKYPDYSDLVRQHNLLVVEIKNGWVLMRR
ncbi:MAG: glycosyltransferase family 39 protein [Candidatus Kapabacteria bacterium]|nr:glycosyltransferase family 39 protein [Candidatus Kapabacteria bacterium]